MNTTNQGNTSHIEFFVNTWYKNYTKCYKLNMKTGDQLHDQAGGTGLSPYLPCPSANCGSWFLGGAVHMKTLD